MLDVYSYSGGFGVLAAARGAKSVTCVDRSQPALNAAKAAAALNGVDKVVSFEKSEVFDALEKRSGKNFEVVICDPPAFVKSRKDLKIGAQAGFISPGGFFSGFDRGFEVTDAPGIFKTFWHAQNAVSDPEFRSKYTTLGERQGVLGVSPAHMGWMVSAPKRAKPAVR